MEKETEGELNFGPMALFIKVNGLMIKLMEMVG
jgi:hypothetical protein